MGMEGHHAGTGHLWERPSLERGVGALGAGKGAALSI